MYWYQLANCVGISVCFADLLLIPGLSHSPQPVQKGLTIITVQRLNDVYLSAPCNCLCATNTTPSDIHMNIGKVHTHTHTTHTHSERLIQSLNPEIFNGEEKVAKTHKRRQSPHLNFDCVLLENEWMDGPITSGEAKNKHGK